MTASEPLSLKEELEMQKSWIIDNDKLTFIFYAKEDLERFEAKTGSTTSGVEQAEGAHPSDDVGQSSTKSRNLARAPACTAETAAPSAEQDAMAGDVNLFFGSGCGDYDIEDDEQTSWKEKWIAEYRCSPGPIVAAAHGPDSAADAASVPSCRASGIAAHAGELSATAAAGTSAEPSESKIASKSSDEGAAGSPTTQAAPLAAPVATVAEVMVMTAEPRYRRRGLGREAVRAVGCYALSVLGVRRLVAKISAGNKASRAMFEGMGFRVCKEVPAFEEVHMVADLVEDMDLRGCVASAGTEGAGAAAGGAGGSGVVSDGDTETSSEGAEAVADGKRGQDSYQITVLPKYAREY